MQDFGKQDDINPFRRAYEEQLLLVKQDQCRWKSARKAFVHFDVKLHNSESAQLT